MGSDNGSQRLRQNLAHPLLQRTEHPLRRQSVRGWTGPAPAGEPDGCEATCAACISESRSTDGGLHPFEDIAFGLENRGLERERMIARIHEILQQIGLSHKAQAEVSTLSGGERQRLAIGCCLALEAEMIIFDEATSMLDPEGRSDIMELAQGLWQAGTTVLWVTQRMEELAASPRIAVLGKGQLLYDGSPRSLFYTSELPETLGWLPSPAVRVGKLLQKQGWPLHLLPLTGQDLEELL